MEPNYKDPFIKKNGNRKIKEWDTASTLRNSALGSLVNAPSSTSTWKRSYTSY